MPKYSKSRRVTQWVQIALQLNAGHRYIDLPSYGGNIFSGAVGSNEVVQRPGTILAAHITAGYSADVPAARSQPNEGWLGIGVIQNAGESMSTYPKGWFGIAPFLPGAGSTTQGQWAAVIDAKAKRILRPGDILNWDYWGIPTAPWNPTVGRPMTIGTGRILVALD